MPAPITYTEDELKTFMVNELSSSGVALSLTIDSEQVKQAVWAVERLLGASIPSITDMKQLEAAARWKAWEAAEAAAADQIDFKAGPADFKLSQWFKQIQSRLARAQAAWCKLVEDSEEADCGFDIAEMVTGPFGYRERMWNEALRDG